MIEAISSVKQACVPFYGGGTISDKPQLTEGSDTFETSVKDKEDKKQRNKVLLAAAAVLAAIGLGIAIYKGRGSKVVEAAESGADSLARKGQEAVSHSKSNEVQPEKPLKKPKVKKDVNPEAGKVDDLEKLKITKLKKDYSIALNKYGIDAEIDDEVLEIINKRCEGNVLGKDFQLERDLIYNPACISDDLLKTANEVSDPLKKEELLVKSFNFFPKKGVQTYWKENTEPEKIETLYLEFRNLYKGNGDFKSKQLFEDTILPKFLNVFENKKSIKVLNEILGSKCDYDLYEQLAEKSKTYKNVWGDETDPISRYKLEWAENDEREQRSIAFFLNDTFPALIKAEANPLKKEDMLMKLINVKIKAANNQKNIVEAYDILRELEALHAKGGAEFVHKDTVTKQLNEMIDAYFSKFKLPLTSEKDKRVLADIVISNTNKKFFYFTPDDVKYSHIIDGLTTAGRRSGDEKYYKAAVDFAIQQNARGNAVNVIEKIKADDKLSNSFKDEMISVQNKLKSELKQIADDTAKMLNAKPLNEAFETLTDNSEVKKVIAEAGTKFNLSSLDVINKMKEGDGKIISYVMKKSISKYENGAYENVKSAFWDEAIQYLSKVDEVVKDPKELEFLKNIRLRVIGAKIMSVRNAAPEQKMIYHNILKSEIIDMLYGKGHGKDIAEKIKIDDVAIEDIARRIGDIVWDLEPETTLYKAIKYNLEEYPHGYSDETRKILNDKLKDMQERLGIRSDEDFYEEFSRRFFGDGGKAPASKLSKDSAKEILNKYLPKEQQLGDNLKLSDVKAAYRQLAVKYHPDKASNAEEAKKFEEIFKEVSEAYGVLK